MTEKVHETNFANFLSESLQTIVLFVNYGWKDVRLAQSEAM